MRLFILYCALLALILIAPIQAAPKLPQIQHFLVISDVHLNQHAFHSMNLMPKTGSILNDLDKENFDRFMDTMVDQIKTGNIPRPKFLLYLGDAVGHVRIGSSFVWENEVAVFAKFTQAFPDIPIFYTFGNNDAFLKNYGPFVSISPDGQVKTPLDAAKNSEHWHNSFISMGEKTCHPHGAAFPCILSQNQVDGYYAAYLEPKLRLIDLNSVMFSIRQSTSSSPEIAAQLTWLEQQLQAAQANHETVLMAMHIPIGQNTYDDLFFLKPEINQRLLELLQRYHSIIMGVLAGHTHMDEMKIIQDEAHRSLVGIYLNPALSTSHGNAPAIRSYTYGLFNDQWQLVDYTTFYFAKNAVDQLCLQKLYRYSEVYCDSHEQQMRECLSHVNILSLEKYYAAGNNKANIPLNYPENVYIRP